MPSKQFDIVLFGATSFVGKILAHYLVEQYGVNKSVKWALAGRSRGKLQSLLTELGADAQKLPLIVADAGDPAALESMCAQTKVVVTTVGPYALYGEPLVQACVESGTDYCDLTGEVQWIKKMLGKYQAKAEQTGARIVHCCGFDSIPSDMGAYFLQQQSQDKFGQPCESIKMRVKRMRGEFSGGTVASLMNAVKEATSDAKLRRELANPYSLCPENHGFSVRQNNLSKPEYDGDFKSWMAPFVMAAINTRIVHRSNALAGNAYGDKFRYDEGMMMGSGIAGAARAYGLTGGMGGFMLAAAMPPTRWVLERFVVPKPGEGPSQESQDKGFYDIRFFGQTRSGETIQAKVYGDKDPGYGSTAKMLGQAAVCLAKDIGKNDKAGGFWTPSTIFGEKLIERLQADAGLSFELI